MTRTSRADMLETRAFGFWAQQEGREQAPVFGQAPALGGCLGGVSGLQVTGTQPTRPSGLSCKQRWQFLVGTGVRPSGLSAGEKVMHSSRLRPGPVIQRREPARRGRGKNATTISKFRCAFCLRREVAEEIATQISL